MQQLKALKEDRMREVLKLKSVDEKLCEQLRMEPVYVPTKVVPTDEQLETLKQHIREMEVSCHELFSCVQLPYLLLRSKQGWLVFQVQTPPDGKLA